MDPSQASNTTSQDPTLSSNMTPHRTHAGNANKHPAEILFATGTIQKRRTKAEKAADDKHLQEEKAVKEEAAKAGLARLGMMEMAAEEKAAKQKMNREKAPVPHPPRRSKTRCEKTRGSGGDAKEAKGLSEPTPASSNVSHLHVATLSPRGLLSSPFLDSFPVLAHHQTKTWSLM